MAANDVFEGLLEVGVTQARNLIAADRNTSDPYCKLRVGKKTAVTKVIDETLNPTWNEKHSLQIRGDRLEIMVLDQDKIGASDPIGFLVIPISDLADEQYHEGWYNLAKPPTEDLDGPYGEILLKLRYCSNERLGTVKVSPVLNREPEVADLQKFFNLSGEIQDLVHMDDPMNTLIIQFANGGCARRACMQTGKVYEEHALTVVNSPFTVTECREEIAKAAEAHAASEAATAAAAEAEAAAEAAAAEAAAEQERLAAEAAAAADEAERERLEAEAAAAREAEEARIAAAAEALEAARKAEEERLAAEAAAAEEAARRQKEAEDRLAQQMAEEEAARLAEEEAAAAREAALSAPVRICMVGAPNICLTNVALVNKDHVLADKQMIKMWPVDDDMADLQSWVFKDNHILMALDEEYALTIHEAGKDSVVYLRPLSDEEKRSQLWHMNDDGNILNAADPNWCLEAQRARKKAFAFVKNPDESKDNQQFVLVPVEQETTPLLLCSLSIAFAPDT